MQIREATAEDDRRVGEILVEAFRRAYRDLAPTFDIPPARLDQLRDTRSRRENNLVLVLEIEGRVSGTVTLINSEDSDCHAWHPQHSEMRFLALDPTLTKSGLGQLLMDEVKLKSQAAGDVGIDIRVRQGLDRLAAYYRNYGFTPDPMGDLATPYGTQLRGYTLGWS